MNESEIITPTAFRNIITRNLPKTSQRVSYAAEDDGDYEAGWWRGKTNEQNRKRFIAKTILGDRILLDRATGLMWPGSYLSDGCNGGVSDLWTDALFWAMALSFAGFSDWRLPNLNELASLLNHDGPQPYVPVSFRDFPPEDFTIYWFWTSTTNHRNTTQAFGVHFGALMIREGLGKANLYKMMAVRKGV
ncbi:MAG: DUF1566 domain-containing protein [Planctomycetes bacterium]|nr:DUF1566 domain-containing protein [Planctomycetota bacterium]